MIRLPRRGRPPGPPPAPFVVGVGRSGTTLLRLMLDAHPQLAIGAETHFVPPLIELAEQGAGAERLLGEITGARGFDELGIDPATLAERVEALERPTATEVLRAFYRLAAESRGKPRWGDKTPGYVRRMRPIAAALPEARFVHLIRDGRDVALSRRMRGMGAGKPIAETAELWRRRIEGARKQARRLRGRYLELRYEDLVADPEAGLRRICALIELDFDPAMLSHAATASERLEQLGDLGPEDDRTPRSASERRAAHALAARPATSSRAGGWRRSMPRSERREFEAVAGPLLRDLGYDVPSSPA